MIYHFNDLPALYRRGPGRQGGDGGLGGVSSDSLEQLLGMTKLLGKYRLYKDHVSGNLVTLKIVGR